MTAVEQYVAQLSSRLHVGRRRRARIEAEVRDHLGDAVERRVDQGMSTDVAVEQAIADFGSPHALAAQFNAEAGTRAMRRAPLLALVTSIAVVAGLLIAAVSQPATSPRRATLVTQVAFFTAVLAFQVAFVAGACAASRAAAAWRQHAALASDRRFVRRGSAISVAALAVAALGWATAVAVSPGAWSQGNEARQAVGAAVMLAAATAGVIAVARLRVNPADDTNGAETAKSGLLGLGERAVGIIRDHPLSACSVGAFLTALAAMRHAETNVVGSLPWGIAQAAAVVAGFVLLGPALHLRRTGSA